LQSLQREQLVAMAEKAKQLQKTEAVAAVVSACEQLAKVQTT
jgi:UDP-N-acetylglucosamine--N-acetylmuramyl-(pentapeptide) pyrophosphoryl-undecaprenol N-acetylglucosamine transferase